MKTSRASSKIKYLADHAGSNHILREWYYLTVVLYQDARRLFWTNLHLLSGSGVIIVMNILYVKLPEVTRQLEVDRFTEIRCIFVKE